MSKVLCRTCGSIKELEQPTFSIQEIIWLGKGNTIQLEYYHKDENGNIVIEKSRISRVNIELDIDLRHYTLLEHNRLF